MALHSIAVYCLFLICSGSSGIQKRVVYRFKREKFHTLLILFIYFFSVFIHLNFLLKLSTEDQIIRFIYFLSYSILVPQDGHMVKAFFTTRSDQSLLYGMLVIRLKFSRFISSLRKAEGLVPQREGVQEQDARTINAACFQGNLEERSS